MGLVLFTPSPNGISELLGDLGGYFTCDTRNIEMLTDSQPANADADSAPNWLPRGVAGGSNVSEAMEGFVTTLSRMSGVRDDRRCSNRLGTGFLSVS